MCIGALPVEKRLVASMIDLQPRPWPDADLRDDAKVQFELLIQSLEHGDGKRPWCLHAIESVRKHRFLVADARSWSVQRDGVTIIDFIAQLFMRTVPFRDLVQSRADTLTALLRPQYTSLEDDVHQSRVALLLNGLVVGAFHPLADIRPLRKGVDKSLRPFRSVGTFLSVRWAVPEDRAFVRKDARLTEMLDRWLQRSHRAD